MPTPQWRIPSIGLGNRFGFDETARPPWLMVGHRKIKTMLLEFGRGKLVKSMTPHIADISKDGSDEGDNSFFMIEGKSPGQGRIEVRNPKTRALEAALAVSVKNEMTYGVTFNFVQDYLNNKTTLQSGIADALKDSLNEIYRDQTNITFELLQARHLPIDLILNDAVIEERDIIDNKMKTGFARLPQEREWNKIFAANANDGFNIYFVPSDKKASENDTLVFTKGSNCIIEDGKQLPMYTLAHAIGRMLGCDFTTDRNRMNQLMFWDPGVESKFFSRSDDCIPRDCANIMNPSP